VSVVALYDDAQLLQSARAGDERAFEELVTRYHRSLLRVAMTYVRNRAIAEEVVQETWLAVIRGLDRFEGRSLLKTWIFRILTNRAKTRAVRESRTIPLSALVGTENGDEGPFVDPERFLPASHSRWPGHWASPPNSWDEIPEAQLLSKETRALIESAIEQLPPMQAQVIALRDVEGWTAEDVCALLDLSAANQRVLLHRARSKVRAALEEYLD
jgi:RNA polymerase sigma-70 factor (ECF subfamily)